MRRLWCITSLSRTATAHLRLCRPVRSDIAQHVAKGRPLIAALQPGAGLPLHYVVIAGIDPEAHVVLLNDPAQRKLLKEDEAQFERAWKATDHWTLLALPEASPR